MEAQTRSSRILRTDNKNLQSERTGDKAVSIPKSPGYQLNAVSEYNIKNELSHAAIIIYVLIYLQYA